MNRLFGRQKSEKKKQRARTSEDTRRNLFSHLFPTADPVHRLRVE